VLWLRAVIVLGLGYWTVRLGSAAGAGCFLDLVNLPFHEAGHLFLTPFGQTMHFLGGTLGQLAVPIGLAVYFLVFQRQPFSAALCSWWAGENLVNISVYMADARDLALPLVGGGDHDWNTLFYQFGLLGASSVARVSTATHRAGVVVMLASVVWAGYFLLADGARSSIEAWLERRAPALRYLIDPGSGSTGG